MAMKAADFAAWVENSLNEIIDKERALLAPGESKALVLQTMPGSVPFLYVVSADSPRLKIEA